VPDISRLKNLADFFELAFVRVAMQVIFYDLLVLAQLSFDLFDDNVDRSAKIIGLGVAEIVHVVAGDVTVSPAKFSLHTEGPADGNSSPEVDLQFIAFLLSVGSDSFAGAHLFEAYC
jgi:hypothetical protein